MSTTCPKIADVLNRMTESRIRKKDSSGDIFTYFERDDAQTHIG